MNRKDIPKVIDGKFLASNPDCIFVFGDNLKRRGYGGGAALRDYTNTYGFITKKYPSNEQRSFYTLQEYGDFFDTELEKFLNYTKEHKDKLFLVSRLGAGLANKYGMFERIIKPGFQTVLRINKNIYHNIILVGWD